MLAGVDRDMLIIEGRGIPMAKKRAVVAGDDGGGGKCQGLCALCGFMQLTMVVRERPSGLTPRVGTGDGISCDLSRRLD